MKAWYVFTDTLVIATASNLTSQSTDGMPARTEKRTRKAQDTTVTSDEVGPKSSNKVSLTLAYSRLMLQGLRSEPKRTKIQPRWARRAPEIMKARYVVFTDTLVIATASNPTSQSTDGTARTEKRTRKAQDTTVTSDEAGPESSKKVSSSSTLL